MRRAAAALLAALAVAGCVGGGGPKGNARKGGVIRIAYAERPDSLDPALGSSPAAREALWLVYTPPLTYRRSSTELIPGLAAGMPRTSDEGRVYSFRFRHGLRYSNGAPLRASDFAATIRRVRRLRSPGATLFAGVASIEANDRTGGVRIKLRRPDSAFPYALATTYAGLVPKATPLRPKTPPPGIGPYAIGRVHRDGGFVLRRNANFALDGVPAGNVDAIVADVDPDRARSARAVIAGRLDYMQAPPPDAMLPELRSKYVDRFKEHPTASTLGFVLASGRKPFDDARVRRGVAYAADGRDLKRLLAGRLAPGCTLLPPGVPGHESPDACPYGDPTGHADLEKARGLVDKAGATGARVAVREPEDDAGRRVLGYWTKTLRKIGLRARLVSPRRRANTWLAEGAPDAPNPAPFFDLLAADDPLLDVDVQRLRLLPLDSSTQHEWAKLDSRAVDSAYVAPLGSETRATFLSERLDSDNCARFNPVYGNDYSSFCLK
ncbi:MAG TPA: ABC transporter substrate-binding protein [Thermoleophilaceae bacterium]